MLFLLEMVGSEAEPPKQLLPEQTAEEEDEEEERRARHRRVFLPSSVRPYPTCSCCCPENELWPRAAVRGAEPPAPPPTPRTHVTMT